jgi:hypothetical protein
MTDSFALGLDHALLALSWTAGVLVVLLPLVVLGILTRPLARQAYWRIDAWRYRAGRRA